MRKGTLAITLASIFALAACKKESKTSTQNTDSTITESTIKVNYQTSNKAVLFEFTSTGCPGCGSWGKPTVASVKAANGAEVVPIAVHIKYGDKFITEISQAIADNRTGSRWTPQLWVDNENATLINSQGYIDGAASVAKINNGIKNKTQDAGISLGAGFELNHKILRTKYGVKLNKPMGNDYYLAAYLMENDLTGDQQGAINNPVKHNHVIMDAAYGAWGKKVSGNGAEQTLEFEHTFKHDASTNSYVAVVLWKKVGNNYQVVDAAEFK